jgi:hypothetical protein
MGAKAFNDATYNLNLIINPSIKSSSRFIGDFSALKGENEVLFPPGTKFQVIGRKDAPTTPFVVPSKFVSDFEPTPGGGTVQYQLNRHENRTFIYLQELPRPPALPPPPTPKTPPAPNT